MPLKATYHTSDPLRHRNPSMVAHPLTSWARARYVLAIGATEMIRATSTMAFGQGQVQCGVSACRLGAVRCHVPTAPHHRTPSNATPMSRSPIVEMTYPGPYVAGSITT